MFDENLILDKKTSKTRAEQIGCNEMQEQEEDQVATVDEGFNCIQSYKCCTILGVILCFGNFPISMKLA